MQSCFQNLDRIEFVMTLSCTGRCRHCSQGEHLACTDHIDGDAAAAVIRTLCEDYRIQSVMTFGGEPLLRPEDVCKIHSTARDAGVPKRHLITNGYFSKDDTYIRTVAHKLSAAGVTKVMLSVDAFHEETIPLAPVMTFARALLAEDVLCVTHPAWLVSKDDSNPYNQTTVELLSRFAEIGISPSKGNVIFPVGNAIKYLSAYFDEKTVYVNPYEEVPDDIHTVSVSQDGSVLGGNIHSQDIRAIMHAYQLRRI